MQLLPFLSLLLLPLTLAAPYYPTKITDIPTPFTITISAPHLPAVDAHPVHLLSDLRTIVAPSGTLQKIMLKRSTLQFSHPITTFPYAAYLAPDNAVTFARGPRNMLGVVGKKSGHHTGLVLTEVGKVWCVKQDRGGAYGLFVKNRGDGGACSSVELVVKK